MVKKSKKKNLNFTANKKDDDAYMEEFLNAIDNIDDEEIEKKLASEEELKQPITSSKPFEQLIKIDLHGLRLDEAKRELPSSCKMLLQVGVMLRF